MCDAFPQTSKEKMHYDLISPGLQLIKQCKKGHHYLHNQMYPSYMLYTRYLVKHKKNIHQLVFVLYTGLERITLWAKLHIQKKVRVKRHKTKQQCGYFCKRLSQKCCNIKFLIHFFRHGVCFSRIVCLSLCMNDLLSQLLQYPRTLFCWKTHN